MTDIEMTRLTGKALGIDCSDVVDLDLSEWNPLKNEDEAFTLIEALNLSVVYNGRRGRFHWTVRAESENGELFDASGNDLKRAVVTCAAQLEAAAVPTDSPTNENGPEMEP